MNVSCCLNFAATKYENNTYDVKRITSEDIIDLMKSKGVDTNFLESHSSVHGSCWNNFLYNDKLDKIDKLNKLISVAGDAMKQWIEESSTMNLQDDWGGENNFLQTSKIQRDTCYCYVFSRLESLIEALWIHGKKRTIWGKYQWNDKNKLLRFFMKVRECYDHIVEKAHKKIQVVNILLVKIKCTID